ncbi:MAG TPA: helix-turn-helix domain-containing protein [Candidatus Xenobia bacterium]|nr:helix-turn-helix domain-containing protein [Candidatus Xenobia bacterium]
MGTRAPANQPPSVGRMVEDVVGCKWSLAVLGAIRRGVRRPGSIRRSIDGLTAKVLNERLRKLAAYGILERRAYPEIPPRVEYRLTAFGRKFAGILRSIERLERQASRRPPRSAAG